jgi:hypothetical protein
LLEDICELQGAVEAGFAGDREKLEGAVWFGG